MRLSFLSLILFVWTSLSLAAVAPMQGGAEERLREEVLKELSPDMRVSIENVYTAIAVPPEASVISLQPRPPFGVVNFIMGWTEKGIQKTTPGNAVVKVYAKVAVSKSPIRHNENFDNGNISFEERDISALRGTGYFEDGKKLFELRANGYLSPGMVVGFNHTQEPYLVTAGQVAELVNIRGGLRVSARVVVLENGKKSSWVKVENPNSKKVLRAKVVSATEVHMR